MTATVTTAKDQPLGGWRERLVRWIPDLPFPVALLLLSVAIGLASGMDDARFLAVFNRGYGQNMGYFAILLFSSFFLAAAISQGEPLAVGRMSVALSPFTGAGMVCPDTSYATLSPIAGRYRRWVAVGSYAGFKLLIPAGPLIIGVGMAADVGRPGFVFTGLALLVPVLLAGLAWLRLQKRGGETPGETPGVASDHAAESRFPAGGRALRRLFPLCGLAVLLLAGFLMNLQDRPLLKFLTSPVGALGVTAALAYGLVPPEQRRECLDTALERTAPLLLVIASATALGVMLAGALPLESLTSASVTRHSRGVLIAVLFGVTALFKVVNGSSMATFAAVPPILAPAVTASGLDLTVAVYAICLGAFVAILPNDSYFWLTQPSGADGERRSTADFTFTAVSIVQGVVGLICLYGYLLVTGNGL